MIGIYRKHLTPCIVDVAAISQFRSSVTDSFKIIINRRSNRLATRLAISSEVPCATQPGVDYNQSVTECSVSVRSISVK